MWAAEKYGFKNNLITNIDNYGNLMIKYISEVPNQPTILLDAHADEIAFYVHDINESGYIQIKTLGGSDASIVPSQQMHILYYLLQ